MSSTGISSGPAAYVSSGVGVFHGLLQLKVSHDLCECRVELEL